MPRKVLIPPRVTYDDAICNRFVVVRNVTNVPLLYIFL